MIIAIFKLLIHSFDKLPSNL